MIIYSTMDFLQFCTTAGGMKSADCIFLKKIGVDNKSGIMVP